MVDALALGASGVTRAGSSPVIRTTKKHQVKVWCFLDFLLLANTSGQQSIVYFCKTGVLCYSEATLSLRDA